jgi:hypothetical protein
MQLLIGISTSRYFPASGTAGFERSFVSGKSRVPAPPPMMTASVFSAMDGQFEGDINSGNTAQKSAARGCSGAIYQANRAAARKAI